MLRLGFFGGTGIEAKGLALRFASAGAAVILGSRSSDRAAEAAAACNAVLGRDLIRGATNLELPGNADILFVAVPFEHALETIQASRDQLRAGHVLVDVTVPLVFRERHAEYARRDDESNSEVVARSLPQGAALVAAFKTIPAALLAELDNPLECDVFVCGDNAAAKAAVLAAASTIPTLRPLDAGPLRMARILERMAVFAVELNRIHRRKGARFRIQGI